MSNPPRRPHLSPRSPVGVAWFRCVLRFGVAGPTCSLSTEDLLGSTLPRAGLRTVLDCARPDALCPVCHAAAFDVAPCGESVGSAIFLEHTTRRTSCDQGLEKPRPIAKGAGADRIPEHGLAGNNVSTPRCGQREERRGPKRPFDDCLRLALLRSLARPETIHSNPDACFASSRFAISLQLPQHACRFPPCLFPCLSIMISPSLS